MNQEALYQERLALIEKAIALEPIGRIPVIYMGAAFSPRFMGMPLAEYCADPGAANDVTLAAMERLKDVDGINLMSSARTTVSLTNSWLSHVSIPGRELPPDSLWQVQEAEVMTVEDYDLVINQGFKAFLTSHLPKVIDAGELRANAGWMTQNVARYVQKYRERGFVPLCVGVTTIPFEPFCGARSMAQFYLDLYRRPETVKAAMDVALPDFIDRGLRSADLSGVPRVWVGGWRSAPAFISRPHWDKFVFPYLYEVVEGLAGKGIISVLHLDQDWGRELERLRELPAKSCVVNLDGCTDIRKAKEVLGDRMAIMGDVPASLFAAGTPEDVFNYVGDLVRDIGPIGLLLAPGCDAPVNTKPENMEAFVAASREFGTVAVG